MSDLADLLEDEEPTSPFWMATFSDMMTLLLAFFVMLVAMSTVEVKKFEEAMSYFTGQRGLMAEQGLMPASKPSSASWTRARPRSATRRSPRPSRNRA